MEPNGKAKKTDMVYSPTRATEHSPARKALEEAKIPCKKPRSGHKSIWLITIGKDLEKIEFKAYVKSKEHCFSTVLLKKHQMVQNRPIWKLIVVHAMSL